MQKFSFIYLPFLFLLYIGIETYLKINHSSICHTQGCELAGALLRFDPLWLNYMGLFSAFILFILGLFSYKKIISSKLLYIFLFSALFFETIMLGYQYFASPEICIFCLGVYGFLLIIAFTSCVKYFFFALPIVISSFVALSFLAIPAQKVFISKNETYLIQSAECSHCKKVKTYMNEHSITFKAIDAADIEAKFFITFLGYKTIPILIVKSSKEIQVINGEQNIIRYFEKSFDQNIQTILKHESSLNSLFFDNSSEEEGCSLNFIKSTQSSCEDNEKYEE